MSDMSTQPVLTVADSKTSSASTPSTGRPPGIESCEGASSSWYTNWIQSMRVLTGKTPPSPPCQVCSPPWHTRKHQDPASLLTVDTASEVGIHFSSGHEDASTDTPWNPDMADAGAFSSAWIASKVSKSDSPVELQSGLTAAHEEEHWDRVLTDFVRYRQIHPCMVGVTKDVFHAAQAAGFSFSHIVSMFDSKAKSDFANFSHFNDFAEWHQSLLADVPSDVQSAYRAEYDGYGRPSRVTRAHIGRPQEVAKIAEINRESFLRESSLRSSHNNSSGSEEGEGSLDSSSATTGSLR